MTRQRLTAENRFGQGYNHSPSMLARRLWLYAFSVGTASWPPGYRYSHPVIHPVVGRKSEGFLLHYVVTGHLNHRVGNRNHVAGPGDVVWMNVDQPVEYANETKRSVRFHWILFNGRTVPELFELLGAGREPLFRGLRRSPLLPIINDLKRTVSRQAPGCEAHISTLLSRLIEELVAIRPIRDPLGAVRDAPVDASEPVLHAIAMLSTAYHVPWSVKYLSHKVGRSMSYFIRQFRKEVGLTPLQYLNHYRIEQAKALLEGTKMTVAEVARTVGIANVQRFSKLFHELSGASPRDYRSKPRRS